MAVAPRCEDGTRATRAADGSLTCRDGSEASCPDGSSPASSRSGPACPVLAPSSAESPECDTGPNPECTAAWERPSCEDGSAAHQTDAGYYTCDDGSEPSCEEDLNPTFNARGFVIACEAPPLGQGQGEDDE